MAGPTRIARGCVSDAARPVNFSFDGRALQGQAGDTLAAALLANGVRLVGRSFKYHRPRGIVTAGPEEPCALVELMGPQGREPNCLATTLELHEGLAAHSQNRWPSLRLDLGAVNGFFARFIPAGFYYKTFMAPGWAWERGYEPLIRRAAGLGRLQPVVGTHAAAAETVHDHVDVLVVGAGAAGLAAAWQLGAAGCSVLLVDQDVVTGGGTLLDERWTPWRERIRADLAGWPRVRVSTRTAVTGAYGHGVFAGLQRLPPAESQQRGGLRERLRVIRARQAIVATGSHERLIAFADNDRPGVMLAGAAHAYLRRHGVTPGQRPAWFVNNDEAYEAAFALTAAGVRSAAIIDPRPDSVAAGRARSLGIEVYARAQVVGVHGRAAVRGVRLDDGRDLEADCLLISGGHSPAIALPLQMGAGSAWRDSCLGFIAEWDVAQGRVVGAAAGSSGLAAAAAAGEQAGRDIAERLQARTAAAGTAPATPAALPPTPADAAVTPPAALWEVRVAHAPAGKSFVDLQNDVTTDDVRLAVREGYEHPEHMKRYTTLGMATDQGRIGGLVGSAVLAQARGLPLAQVGVTRPRPYTAPVPFAALAGPEVRAHFKPKRRLALHPWHEMAGATFVNAGLWLRPLVYSPQPGWEPVLREARAVRTAAGITDVSTLGKIDVRGADAARFLDFVYANTFSTLAVGRARYGIMLREDGMLLDDGTTSRLGDRHYLVTTTTANHAAVLEHLEFQLQSNACGWDVLLTDVTDQWAQFAVAGPRARELLTGLIDRDLGNEAFPFMAAAAVDVTGDDGRRIAGRLFRISFSGELAYELAVPARHALSAWLALLRAGRPLGALPYGLDALNTLRIEKGHITGAELNGNAGADDLGFARLLKKNGDFIGRVLSQRLPGGRLQLVALRPLDPAQRLRNGAQLLAADGTGESLGFITSSTPSVVVPGWVGLALLADGRRFIGQRLLACSPLHAERTPVEVLSPHWFDPENQRVRA